MNWVSFHHPDISLPVIRRKVGDEILSLLAGTAELTLSGGRSCIYKGCYPSTRAFHSSIKRLHKSGLIAMSKGDGSLPTLKLTAKAKSKLPAYYTPHSFWNARWNKWWYVLMFDVPEKNRAYRDTLRLFLKQKRFGCLQKSVWVTPRDVRPDYDDLNRTACVDSVAFLFEARTVLGFGNQSVVREAWNFNTINQIQDHYIRFASENITLLENASGGESAILQLLRIDNLAYAKAMSFDPLLPKELHPADYKGVRAADLHQELICRALKKIE